MLEGTSKVVSIDGSETIGGGTYGEPSWFLFWRGGRFPRDVHRTLHVDPAALNRAAETTVSAFETHAVAFDSAFYNCAGDIRRYRKRRLLPAPAHARCDGIGLPEEQDSAVLHPSRRQMD
jgi:hypothetical protein